MSKKDSHLDLPYIKSKIDYRITSNESVYTHADISKAKKEIKTNIYLNFFIVINFYRSKGYQCIHLHDFQQYQIVTE